MSKKAILNCKFGIAQAASPTLAILKHLCYHGVMKRPNILIIMSDQHAKNFLGCYGNSIVRTPNLDRLAAEGLRFSNAYCPSPLCVPSRMSFMTGCYPSNSKVWNNKHVLSSGIPTWAHSLGAAGYETALIGRMHFVGPDQRHGFEKRPIGEYSALHPGAALKGGPRWTKFPAATSGQRKKGLDYAGTGKTHYQWFDDRVTEQTEKYLTEKGKEQGSSKNSRPFAAVAGFVLPHCPFIAPKDLYDYYYPLVDVPSVEERQPEVITRYRRIRGIQDPLPEERVRILRAAYYALCEYMDNSIGRILNSLEENGLDQNTLVIYVSDHGELAGSHGCYWKSTYYEGSAGIPFIVRGPGIVNPGRVDSGLVSLYDIAPTLCEAAGTQTISFSDGSSFLNRLKGSTSSPEVLISELVDQNGAPDGLASGMIRMDVWKLWIHHDDESLPPALFNLKEDPGELNDLGEDPGHAGIRDALAEELFLRWDPAAAQEGALRKSEAYELLVRWGEKINPESEDALPVPPPEIEDDVELK